MLITYHSFYPHICCSVKHKINDHATHNYVVIISHKMLNTATDITNLPAPLPAAPPTLVTVSTRRVVVVVLPSGNENTIWSRNTFHPFQIKKKNQYIRIFFLSLNDNIMPVVLTSL